MNAVPPFASLAGNPFLLLALGAAATVLLTFLLTFFLFQPRIQRLREENIRLRTELEAARKSTSDQSLALQQARDSLGNTFNSLAMRALRHNSQEFLRLAQENMKRFHVRAQNELGQREKTMEDMVAPIRAALERTEQHIRTMDQARIEAQGALYQHLESMAEAQRLLQTETRSLVNALRRPEVRGQWGELTLKRLAELAGMVEYCDFFEQEQVQDEEGTLLRPDMIIRMPDRREIIVDAKTPLDAYLNAVEATDDVQRRQSLQQHARKVRERMRELAAKSYWQQFSQSPDFVVLFIPGDQFLASALELDPDLLEDALANKVILATPTSLVALLRAVAYGWRQLSLAENAEKIRQLGEELYTRIAIFSEHLTRLGKSLDSSVGHFNKAVGTLDSRVLPSMRRFREMGITARKDLADVAQVERLSREVAPRDDA